MPTWDSITRKVVVTVVTGVISFFLANAVLSSRTDIAFQLGTSIFLGGVALVIVHLIEVDKRLRAVEVGQTQHAESTERMLHQGFNEFSQATEIFAQLDSSKIGKDVVMNLVQNASRINVADGLVFKFAQCQIQRLGALVKELTQSGDSVYEGEDRDWMLDLTRSASTSIDAVSLTTVDFGVDGGLWLTDLGQRYLELQRDAINRGVATRRVFIAENAARMATPEFLEICHMHQRLGVDVRVLDVNDAPGTLASTMFDFIVFDNVLSYESIPASHTMNQKPIIIITTRLVRLPDRVNERVKRFADLWEAATDLGVLNGSRQLTKT
jgi:hypothetical protein